MTQDIYYLSINSTSLAHYIGKAIIVPSRFYDNRPSDVQSMQGDYLILSKDKFLNASNCSIELILNEEELINFQDIEKNIFLYSKPIPISRIRKIYFIDEIQKLKTIDSINRGAAFLPGKLIEIVEEASKNIDIKVNNEFKYSAELESKIKTYNHILGGIAFVRFNDEGSYSSNHFSILSHFNQLIKNKYEQKFHEIVDNKYDGAFTSKGKYWSELSPLLYEAIVDTDVEEYAKKESVFIDKSNGVFKYEFLDDKAKLSLTYKLAILSIYGTSSTKRKSVDDLLADFANGKISQDKVEGISLIFGINHGYESFRNVYGKKVVKFKMDSLLDYYTIESIFQYAINEQKENNSFNHIDKLFPNEELIVGIFAEKDNMISIFFKNTLEFFKKNYFTTSPDKLIQTIFDNIQKFYKDKINLLYEENKNINVTLNELLKENDKLKKQLFERENLISHEENLPKLKDTEEKESIIIEKTLELNDKSLADLKKIASDNKIKYKNKDKKSELIKSIMLQKNDGLFK